MESFDSVYIDTELEEIGSRIRTPTDIYLIGGCAMAFRKLKEATKDMDIVFRSKEDYKAFCSALFGAQYHISAQIKDEHGKLDACVMYENKDKFHLDLFVQRVCGKMALSQTMIARAEPYKTYGNLNVLLISKEDIFIFKGLASESRKRDLSDMRIIYPNLDWNIAFAEIRLQNLSGELVAHIVRRFEEFGKMYGLDIPIMRQLKRLAKTKDR
ncbi:hypothetical protein KJ780_02200 [Candidatus Micrarchaeota archaeon]|nr:hypothetical protein [Candidatus Micrarchaeota archaeon]